MQVVMMGLLLRYVKQMMETLAGARAAVLPPPVPAAREGPAPVPVVQAPKAGPREAGRPEVPGPVPVPAPAPAPAAPAVDLLAGSPDIQGSILRLCEKYDLADFIIATLDGLLVVSLSPGSSEEAARFSDLYRRKKKPDNPGVTFLEMNHRGEAMLGIIRSDRPIPPEKLRGIGEDAREILNWWL
jgi:hypothetical protein